MSKPKLSVIITSKDEEKFIEACLKSLRCQTFRDFEVIVSDAKSRDGTARIARRYADRVVVKKTNVAQGRNLGASLARAPILVFVDADTVLMVDTLEKIEKAFRGRGVVGATCSVLPATAEARYVGVYMFYNRFCKASIKIGRPQVAGFFCAYRKDAFDSVGGFDENVGVLEDYHLSRRIGELGRIEFVNSALVITSHRRLKKWGLKTPQRYMRAWLKMILNGRSYGHEWYGKVR